MNARKKNRTIIQNRLAAGLKLFWRPEKNLPLSLTELFIYLD